MLATLPSAAPEHDPARRPAKDKEAFFNLLPPAVEFVEGSSSGSLIVGHSKLEPINGSPKQPKRDLSTSDKPQQAPREIKASPAKPSKHFDLYSGVPSTNWLFPTDVGKGLNNTGNTCFLNSTLQCLLHTAPLHHVLNNHGKQDCRIKNGFCMSCALKTVMVESLSNKSRASLTPHEVTKGLRVIAKHMIRGRQEDSHEFLRFAVDALQKSCLAGHPPKLDPKIAETTWVHKIFGGRLRSRVTCGQCRYNSDTYDSILDLSLEINGVRSLREALQKFTKVDHLTGTNKYKCEKCKKLVSAQKQFTVHEAPLVLTIHLKRFSPLGRKIGHPITYEERISLSEVMSERTKNLGYSLYGVICHAGGGPNSGHYFAHVKGGRGIWYEMNDESVTRCPSPTNLKNAYILFYIRDKGHALQNAIAAPISAPTTVASPSASAPLPMRPNLAAGMKKRKRTEDDGEPGPKRPFIGPVRSPATPVSMPANSRDPQALALQRKIASASQTPSTSAAKPTAALNSALAGYGDDEDDVGEKVSTAPVPPDSERPAPPAAPASSTPTPSRPAPTLVATSTPVPTKSFYAPPAKRKAQDDEAEQMAQFGLPSSFTAKTFAGKARSITYGKRHGSLEKRRKTVAAV